MVDMFSKLQNLMIKYHFRPNKQLSQFYCINEAMLIYITHVAKLTKKDTVLEIGPGTGFMTRYLLDKSKKVIAIEKDRNMIELLEQEFATEIKEKKLVLIHDDALKIDFSTLGVNKIVSLPPYNLSSQIVTKIALSNGIKKAVLVLDTGFIEKLTAFEGLKEYVALSALLNLNAKIDVVQKIDKSSFFPNPNCLSAIVDLDFDVIENSNEFYLFLKQLFRHKNKDLSRGLKQAFDFLEKEIGWTKKTQKKFDSLKLKGKKVYLMSPEELIDTFDEINE
ncbi:MAG: rRNA adenine N-6-methyltransferase family protein [archaeon]|jgi:16S rRNA (adenine1518-N6/adenine1519-N6)-dimethyltransferase